MARKQLVPLDMNTNKVTNLGTPTSGTDAATKDYVDANSGGSLNRRIENVNAQTIEWTDDIVYAQNISQIFLPHDTTGHVGKLITIVALESGTTITEFNTSPAINSNTYLQFAGDQVTLEALEYGAGTINWRVLETHEMASPRISDYDSAVQSTYIPYTGAVTDIDLGGLSIKNVVSIYCVDNSVSLSSGNSNTAIDTPGYEVSFNAGSAYGDGDGGRASVVAGSADYTGGGNGNGGNVYLQTGSGAGTGQHGRFEISRTGKAELIYIGLENITADRALEFPDSSGTLVASDGTNKITTGTTAPTTPSIGDLWVDTN